MIFSQAGCLEIKSTEEQIIDDLLAMLGGLARRSTQPKNLARIRQFTKCLAHVYHI